MAISVIETPIALNFGTGNNNPAAQNITSPSGATHAILFWGYGSYTVGAGLLSATLAGNNPDQTVEVAVTAGEQNCSGAAIWLNPASGTLSLDVAWDANSLSSTGILAFIQNGGTVRDLDSSYATSGALQVTVDTVINDLVLAFVTTTYTGSNAYSTMSGYTSLQTCEANTLYSRLQYIVASSSSTSGSVTSFSSGMTLLALPELILGQPVSKRMGGIPFASQNSQSSYRW